ncbi:putative transmembrane GTPase FZO-like, chloroplastic [Iris pallida]|uniref:Transmembrane GTPase FZO-like, chloroplastic n=1 Tax=Iris pallida TaxID=29817 RepID=A0AAX6E0F0_IRIPA|nr:putative transmembrane GTPase FZO-like, chloroplastic [Iris pallida]
MDIYRNTSEVEEVTAFIKENTRKLLNIEDIRLYPISARSALEAKLSVLNYDGDHEELLSNDSRWTASRFHELEKFLFSFLDGSTNTGKERIRLKLETPIGIADRLLTSCVRLVKQEYENACQDLISIEEIINSIDVYAMKMESESISWIRQTVSLIVAARDRAVKLLESILQLSNIDLVTTYAFKGEKSVLLPATLNFQNEIIVPALTETQRLLGEYSMWLQSKNGQQRKLLSDRFYEQFNSLIGIEDKVQLGTNEFLGKGEELSIRVVENFGASAASRLFEQEIREVVLGTFGGLGAAGLSASLLTSVLPTTLEDLLALTFCSAGGLLAISKFAGRRKEAIEKVRKVADGLEREIEEAMQKDLRQGVQSLKYHVEAISKPYRHAAERRIDRLLKFQDELANVEEKLRDLKVEIQNLHAM